MPRKKTEKIKFEKPDRIKAEEIEDTIVKLSQQGLSPAKIGLVLRDKHDIPKIKLLGKKISKILKEKSLQAKTDLQEMEKQIENLEKHFQKNKQDKRAKRDLITKVSRAKKLRSYLER